MSLPLSAPLPIGPALRRLLETRRKPQQLNPPSSGMLSDWKRRNVCCFSSSLEYWEYFLFCTCSIIHRVYLQLSLSKSGGFHDMLPIYPLCGISQFPWHRNEERLKICGLTMLETRSRLGGEIDVFKILNGYWNIDDNIF